MGKRTKKKPKQEERKVEVVYLPGILAVIVVYVYICYLIP